MIVRVGCLNQDLPNRIILLNPKIMGTLIQTKFQAQNPISNDNAT